MKTFLTLGLVSLLIATSAHAATIGVTMDAFATDASAASSSGRGFLRDENPLVTTFETDAGSLSGSFRREASAGTSLASSQTSYDVETGELKVAAESTVTETTRSGFRSRAVATAGVSITEDITASGAGTVTAKLAVDGFWSTSEVYDNRFGDAFSLGSSLIVSRKISGAIETSEVLLTAADDGLAGVADFVVTLMFDVTDGEAFSLRSALGTNVPQGTSNFLNTATLALETTAGLDLNFATSGFLSKAQVTPVDPTPAAVPLPAGAWLMLSGLAGFAFMRRKL